MLQRLTIKNLALLQDVTVEFADGLNVISGESGAGKTTLVKAIGLVLGAEADSQLIGPNGEEAYVEAAFTDPVPLCLQHLVDPEQELTLARRLRKQGSSRALAGGRSCSAAQLREAGHQLLALTGQHAAQRLVSSSYQRKLLDQFAATDLGTEVEQSYTTWQTAENELSEFRQLLLDGQQRTEIMKADIESYDAVQPLPGELPDLELKHKRLQNADQLREQVHEASQVLIREQGANEQLATASSLLRNLDDPETDRLLKELDDISERTSDIARDLRGILESADYTPSQLEETEQRLLAIHELQRRFRGASIEEIETRIERSRSEVDQLQSGEERLQMLEKITAQSREAYNKLATQLRVQRTKTAKKLAKATEGYFAALGLKEARLLIDLSPQQPKTSGIDAVSFRLQANKGLSPVPLDKGASGGELARVNLALSLAARVQEQAYLFDEVDNGIGGHTAHSVAEQLVELSESSQLIVITHLAQIAVKANRNILVAKEENGEHDHTYTDLLVLDADGRQQEIARLMGAEAADADTAAKLLESASR